MVNNNEQESYANSLKASFCRHLFPELIQFLTDFDISEQPGKPSNDSLNMHFILQAYHYKEMSNSIKKIKDPIAQNEEHQKEIRALKEVCKWKLSDVSETDVLIAIDEFFDITSQTEQMSHLRDELIKKATFPGTHLKEWKFVDITTKSIINYFGIELGDKDEIGPQRQAFSNFVKYAKNIVLEQGTLEITAESSYYDQYEELRFTNAFRLFRCLRNWWGHEYEGYTNDEFIRYHRFILYTQIGLVYVSRRLWKKYKENLETKYTTPPSKQLEAEKINVELIADKKNEIISECEYQIEGFDPVPRKELKGNKVTFDILVPKYTPFTIRFQCEAYSYELTRKMNYYAWNPTLTITVQPPAKIHCSFKGIAGPDESLETIIGNLFTQYLGSYSNPEATREQKETNEKILNQLAAIEPLLREIHGFAAKNEEKNEEIIARLNEEKDKLNNLDKSLEKIYGTTSDTAEGVREIKETLLSWEKTGKGVVIFFILLLIGYVYYQCLTNNLESNISWLRYRFFYIPLALLAIGLTFRLLTNTWNPRKAIKEKGQLKYWITGAVALLLFGSPFLFRYQSTNSLVEDYEFLGQDSVSNQSVANYLENHISSDEESIRSKLALYYCDIVGDLKKAEYFSSPMLDVEKYKEGSLVAMYVLYCQKEIPVLASFIERYGKCYGEDNPDYCDLMGALLVDTLYDERDIEKGKELLWKAYEAGSDNACFNLGYYYSTDMSTYEARNEGKDVQESKYNLPLAVNLLKRASFTLPKASLLLGDIFADLQMVDSAAYYYSKAINETNEGFLYQRGVYKLALLCDKNGFEPNDFLLNAQSMKYPPALLYSSIVMESDTNLLKNHRFNEKPFTDYIHILFEKKGHKRAIRWYESAIKNGEGGTLKEMGVYQFIPPVVLDRIYIGEKKKALTILQENRKDANFDALFVDAVELLLGSTNVKRDSITGMKLMHESANNGCLYSKLFCLYRDTEKELINNPNAHIDTVQLNTISKDIPFAHVIKALLLMREGDLKNAEDAAHLAMWEKHPAGAFALEFMPENFYATFESSIKNRDKELTKSDLFYKLKIQEMALRSTWSNKDNSLVMTCVLDKVLHDRLGEDFTNDFVFWTNVAISNNFPSSQLRLLQIYYNMITNGYKDSDLIIDPLLRSVLMNFNRGSYDLYPNYNEYIIMFLKFLDSHNFLSKAYLDSLFRFFYSHKLDYYWENVKKPLESLNTFDTYYINLDFRFIDDFSLLTEFSYIAGPYSLKLGHVGNVITIIKYMKEQDYYNLVFN